VASSRFEENCLTEYAETFHTVCVDAAFYVFPDEPRLRTQAAQVPDNFRFAFKSTEEITVKRWPSVQSYGARGGNCDFALQPEPSTVGTSSHQASPRLRYRQLQFRFIDSGADSERRAAA
jgi:uncharacterized protein YecE (DUF72 family)